MTPNKDVTVIIGRFNPFHNGHAYLLTKALDESHLVIVLVGSSGQSRSLKNPFTFSERAQMIERWKASAYSVGRLPGHLMVLSLNDYPYSNSLWIKSVQDSVKMAIDRYQVFEPVFAENFHNNVTLMGSDRDDSTWYLKAFPQWKLDLLDEHHVDLSGTGVREVLYTQRITKESINVLSKKIPASTKEFLIDFAECGKLEPLQEEYAFIKKYKKSWEAAPYAPTFSTADAVVIQSGHVLVVKRGANPGRGLWALPGGFVNQKERVEDAAIRELIEETGIKLADGKRSAKITEQMLRGAIRGKELFDAPDRSARGRTITVAYLFKLDDTKPLPPVKGQNVPVHEAGGKEIVETEAAMWLPLNEALQNTELWFEDHHSILTWAAGVKD